MQENSSRLMLCGYQIYFKKMTTTSTPLARKCVKSYCDLKTEQFFFLG